MSSLGYNQYGSKSQNLHDSDFWLFMRYKGYTNTSAIEMVVQQKISSADIGL